MLDSTSTKRFDERFVNQVLERFARLIQHNAPDEVSAYALKLWMPLILGRAAQLNHLFLHAGPLLVFAERMRHLLGRHLRDRLAAVQDDVDGRPPATGNTDDQLVAKLSADLTNFGYASAYSEVFYLLGTEPLWTKRARVRRLVGRIFELNYMAHNYHGTNEGTPAAISVDETLKFLVSVLVFRAHFAVLERPANEKEHIVERFRDVMASASDDIIEKMKKRYAGMFPAFDRSTVERLLIAAPRFNDAHFVGRLLDVQDQPIDLS